MDGGLCGSVVMVVMCDVWQASMSPEDRAAALASMCDADRAAALVRRAGMYVDGACAVRSGCWWW